MGSTTSTTRAPTTTTASTPSPAYSTIGTIGYFLLILALFAGSFTSKFGAVINNIEEGLIRPEYDYIIIGAGSAGATLAARLSEDLNVTVLLLEAGDERTTQSQLPLLAQYLQGTDEDWQFRSEPQSNAARVQINNQVKYVQGRSLGGSSNVNYMIYTRGNRRCYDNWEAMGNDGWGWEDVFPYFMKAEGNRNTNLTRTPYHNASGPLSVEDVSYRTPLAPLYLQAAKALGYKIVDINGATQSGFAYPQTTTFQGSRWSSSRAYLYPIRNRSNLHISMRTFVHKINIDPATKRATGVVFERSIGSFKTIRARKEVILSAGALQTPKLLTLSGVGPAAELARLNVTLIKNLPVGENLQDHVTTGGIAFLINKPWSFVDGRIFADAINVFSQYFARGEGPITSPGSVEALGFVKTKYENATDDYPDMEFMIASGWLPSDGGTQLRKNYNIKDEIYTSTYQPYENFDMFNIFPIVLRPKSRGRVTCRSTDPRDPPRVEPNYYNHPDDMKVMVEGCKIAINMTRTPALQTAGSVFFPNIFPNCRNFTIGSDEFCECYARDFTATFWHFSGTAKMGPASDPTAVVDNRLRVHGILGLRVVDNSIMPTLINAHTNAPAIMIGEKAADMIKEDNRPL